MIPRARKKRTRFSKKIMGYGGGALDPNSSIAESTVPNNITGDPQIDSEAEAAAIQQLGPPQSLEDQIDLYEYVYGANMPDAYKTLQNALDQTRVDPNQDALQNIGQGVSAFGQQAAQAAGDAQANAGQIQMGLNVLQEALKVKSGIGNQPLGESDVFQELGVTGIGALNKSLSARMTEMQAKHRNFSNVIKEVADAQIGQSNAAIASANTALSQYEMLLDEYRYQQGRLDELEQYEQSLADELEIYAKKAEIDHQYWLKEQGSEKTSTGSAWLDYILGSSSSGYGNFDGVDSVPPASVATTSSLGSGVISGYGSYQADGTPIWEWGLDFVLDGGKGAEITLPFNFEVIEVDTGHGAGEANSFGNRVKIRDENGREIWFSHLDSVVASPGIYTAGTAIGTQGNTGTTGSTRGVPGNDNDYGTHIDITMPKEGGGYYTPEEVAAYMGFGGGGGLQGSDTTEAFEIATMLNTRNISEEQQSVLLAGYVSGQYSAEDIDALTETPESIKEEFQVDANALLGEVAKGNASLVDVYDTLVQDLGYANIEGMSVLDELLKNDSISTKDKWELDFQVSMRDFLEDYARENPKIRDVIQNPIASIMQFGSGILDMEYDPKLYLTWWDAEKFLYGDEDLPEEYAGGFVTKYPQFEKQTKAMIRKYFNLRY